MNERIRELAEQCYEKHELLGTYEFNKEKFAKLIVLEVLQYQETLVSEGHNAWHLNEPTKKHFGVEE